MKNNNTKNRNNTANKREKLDDPQRIAKIQGGHSFKRKTKKSIEQMKVYLSNLPKNEGRKVNHKDISAIKFLLTPI